MLFIVFIFFFLRVHYCHICNMHILFIAVECTCSHFTITNLIEESSCSLVLFIHSQDVCLCFEPTQYTQNIDHKNLYRFQLPFGILMYQQCNFFFRLARLDSMHFELAVYFLFSPSPLLSVSLFLLVSLPFSPIFLLSTSLSTYLFHSQSLCFACFCCRRIVVVLLPKIDKTM